MSFTLEYRGVSTRVLAFTCRDEKSQCFFSIFSQSFVAKWVMLCCKTKLGRESLMLAELMTFFVKQELLSLELTDCFLSENDEDWLVDSAKKVGPGVGSAGWLVWLWLEGLSCSSSRGSVGSEKINFSEFWSYFLAWRCNFFLTRLFIMSPTNKSGETQVINE